MTPTEQGSRRCDFSRVRCGVVSCNILSRGTICNFVNFYLTHASFVSSRACIGFITVLFGLASAEPDVVTLSSSDTKEALELLSLSPDRGVSSQPSRVGGGGGNAQEPSSGSNFGSDLFEDWPKANDMAVSIYVALTAESSSQAPIANALHNERKPRVGGSLTQWPCSQAAMLRVTEPPRK
jgi:hypothetical protein